MTATISYLTSVFTRSDSGQSGATRQGYAAQHDKGADARHVKIQPDVGSTYNQLPTHAPTSARYKCVLSLAASPLFERIK
jgi:hypothetical protein